MKFIFLFLGVFVQNAFADYKQDINLLKKQKTYIESLMKKAHECLPTVKNGDHHLCTGVVIPKNKWVNLKNMDLKTCEEEIIKNGFSILDDSLPRLGQKYPNFISSTLRAETRYQEKLVLFKRQVINRIDCLHELIHIYQHDLKNTADLAPHNRQKLEDNFLKVVNQAIVSVEEAEKSKDIERAKKMGLEVADFITFIGEWKKLDHWLDEKDDHYFIYKNCSDLKCEEIDKDIALANLFNLRMHMPQKIQKEIIAEALNQIKIKQARANSAVKKSWVPFSITDEEIEKMLTMSWKEILVLMKDKGLTFYKVPSPYIIKALKSETISTEDLDTIPDLPKGFVEANSKVYSGDAFAKYLNKEGKDYIVLTPMSTRSSVIHEYLHSLQADTNPAYVLALEIGQAFKEKFEKNKISREEYEWEVIKANATVWMGEFEVYERLVKLEKLHIPIERQNNLELYKAYKTKLQD